MSRTDRYGAAGPERRARSWHAWRTGTPRVQQRKLAHQLPDVSVAGEPVEQDPAGGPGVLGGGPLPGRHIPTAGQNHQSPRSLPAAARRPPAQRSYAAGHAASLPYVLRDAREPPNPARRIDGGGAVPSWRRSGRSECRRSGEGAGLPRRSPVAVAGPLGRPASISRRAWVTAKPVCGIGKSSRPIETSIVREQRRVNPAASPNQPNHDGRLIDALSCRCGRPSTPPRRTAARPCAGRCPLGGCFGRSARPPDRLAWSVSVAVASRAMGREHPEGAR